MQGLKSKWVVSAFVVAMVLGLVSWLSRVNLVKEETTVRLEAIKALLETASYQERHYWTNGYYSEALMPLGYPSERFVTSSGSWSLSVDPGANKEGFTARVDYIGKDNSRFKRNCRWLTISSSGQRSSGPDPNCWPRTRQTSPGGTSE